MARRVKGVGPTSGFHEPKVTGTLYRLMESAGEHELYGSPDGWQCHLRMFPRRSCVGIVACSQVCDRVRGSPRHHPPPESLAMQHESLETHGVGGAASHSMAAVLLGMV